MRPFIQRLALTAAATLGLSGAALMTSTVANAASCSSFDNVTSCIAVSGSGVDSSESLGFGSIPAGCTASISLYKEINGVGQQEFSVPVKCVKGHAGDLLVPFALVGHGTFYTVACADWNTGGACAYSPFLNA